MSLQEQALTEQVIAACIEVHKHLGPGLLESTYQHCLVHELGLRGLRVRNEVNLPVVYKGVRLDCGYRMDLVVEDKVLIEIKCIEKVLSIHEAQLLTYMRLRHYRVGFLIKFNVPVLTQGIVRRVL